MNSKIFTIQNEVSSLLNTNKATLGLTDVFSYEVGGIDNGSYPFAEVVSSGATITNLDNYGYESSTRVIIKIHDKGTNELNQQSFYGKLDGIIQLLIDNQRLGGRTLRGGIGCEIGYSQETGSRLGLLTIDYIGEIQLSN